jgi:ABC-2 type transport system permease protein
VSTEPAAQVFDIRYRLDDGERVGRRRALWSLTRWSALRALGVTRDWKAKVGPFAMIVAALAPAISVLGVRALITDRTDFRLPTEIISYRDYAGIVGTAMLVFAAIVAPRLMCEDRAERVLPLYFSTAVGSREYVGAKLLAAFMPMLLVTAAPALVLFAGNVVFTEHPLAYLGDHFVDIGRILAGGTAMAVYYAVFALAVASFTGRTAFAIAGFIAIVLGSGAVSGVVGASMPDFASAPALALSFVPVRIYESFFPGGGGSDGGPLGAHLLVYALVVGVGLAILATRYRSADR